MRTSESIYKINKAGTTYFNQSKIKILKKLQNLSDLIFRKTLSNPQTLARN